MNSQFVFSYQSWNLNPSHTDLSGVQKRELGLVPNFHFHKVLIQKSHRFSARFLYSTAFPSLECFQCFSQAVTGGGQVCYVHSWFSIVPTAWVPFVWLCFDLLIHTPVCNVPATEKFLPSSLWLLRGAKANILGSHHKLLLMFQEKRSSSSCRLLGR